MKWEALIIGEAGILLRFNKWVGSNNSGQEGKFFICVVEKKGG